MTDNPDKPDDTNAPSVTEATEINSGFIKQDPAAVIVAAVVEPSSLENAPSNATATVFAWLAFFLISSAFIALIWWGSFTTWYIGLIAVIIYTVVLLVIGISLQRRDGWKNSVLVSLVFLLALASMAVAGLYLPINVFPCSLDWSYNDDNFAFNNDWLTNLDDMPIDVRAWWIDVDSNSYKTTFVYLESTGVTLFEGIQQGGQWEPRLWRTTQDRVAPELVPDLRYPEYFVEVGNSAACFAVQTDGVRGSRKHQKIGCTTDGLNFAETEQSFSSGVQDLFYTNERVWFRGYPPYDPERLYLNWRTVLYSVNPSNLTDVVFHSTLSNQEQDGNVDDDDDGCTNERTTFIRFLSWLFLSALPALIAAIAIDVVHKFAVPTMPIGTYCSFTWLVVCLGFAIDPANFEDRIYDFFRWWLVFTTGPWLLYLTLQHLTNRSIPSRRSWSINFASLIYAGGMFLLVKMFDYDYYVDYFWQWAVLTLAVVPPLFLVSVITSNIFVLVVVSAVLMVDVWRLTNYIAYDVLKSNSIVPIQAVVLGLSGLLLGYLGYLLSRKQANFVTRVSKWACAKLGKWVVATEGEGKEEKADVALTGSEEEDHV
jgi:hypothetical protein